MNSIKYKTVVELVRRRVLNGDYMFMGNPSERGLAQETGVSYMTARRAVQELIKEKILVRMKNGRLQPNSRYSNGHSCRQVALVTPAWYSPNFYQWHTSLKNTVEKHGGILRSVTYDNHDDPVIYDALDGKFDLVILNGVNPSPTLKLRLGRSQKKVVSLFRDMSELGILSIDGVSPDLLDGMIGRLTDLGHRRIAYFNTQQVSTVMSLRLSAWKLAMQKRALPEIILNEPVLPFQDSSYKSHEVLSRLLKRKELPFTAVFSTTVYTARGILRALHEADKSCPEDLSIFSLGDVFEARLCIPSIATIDTRNLESFVEDIYLRVLKGNINLKQMHYCPEHEYFKGESIGPA